MIKSAPHEEREGFRKGMPARVAADGRRVVAPALRPALGASGSAGAGMKAAVGLEAFLEGQERSRPLLPCGARVFKGACPLSSGSCEPLGPVPTKPSQPVSWHPL